MAREIDSMEVDTLPSMKQAGLIQVSAYKMRVAILSYAISAPQDREQAAAKITQERAELEAKIKAYDPLVSDAQEQGMLDRVKDKLVIYFQEVDALLAKDRNTSSEELRVFIYKHTAPAANEAIKAADDLIQLATASADGSAVDAHKMAENGFTTTTIIIVLAIALAAVITVRFPGPRLKNRLKWPSRWIRIWSVFRACQNKVRPLPIRFPVPATSCPDWHLT